MIEAVGVVVAPLAEARPAEKLLALYASGLKAEAGKLTLGMIKETSESIKLSPKVVKWVQAEGRAREFPYSPTEVAERIRDGWLRWVGENEGPEVVQHFSARWKEALRRRGGAVSEPKSRDGEGELRREARRCKREAGEGGAGDEGQRREGEGRHG